MIIKSKAEVKLETEGADELKCKSKSLEDKETETQQEFKEEHYAFDIWGDEEYCRILRKCKERREYLIELARAQGCDKDKPSVDVPHHIRDWFENPIYQTLIKPSKCEILKLLRLSKCLAVSTFIIGVLLLALGVYFVVSSGSADPIKIVTLLLSGTASIIASLFKAIAVIKDTATQYAKLQISISAGMISLDALARVLEGQTKLKTEELETVQEITKALAPLIKAFERAADRE